MLDPAERLLFSLVVNESFSFHFSGSRTELHPSVLSKITVSFSHEGSCLLSSVFQGEE